MSFWLTFVYSFTMVKMG